MDTLFINDITLPCTIGVTELERKEKQTLIITVALSVDLQKAGETDNVNDTVNYSTLYQHIVKVTTGSKFFLMEALAQQIATVCLEDKRVKQAKIRIEKPKTVRLARSAAVEIIRTNE
ncbi:MAG: dihydroneopterin aldolase [Patescibacteria group bacterium]